ncbi:hypothetical protein CC86DRAFT_420454 [Ophiobolus disseminans]|uniref:Protein NO VEIN C-terminal domain-containing protein n=1 Tax=Ophiobolus disseminans TaxID=1469910 RepID=A0A6A6ZWW2_9PLEO|nr:hypothetical protein CC86DRAFT_420454 [Ophiobolus disseminans]
MWDGDLEQWVTRSECILNGPDFISFTTVLSRTYGEDALVHSLFSTILGIPDCQIGDVLEELESRRDNGSAGTHLSLTSRIYAFLATKASTEDDWQKIKSAFTEKNLVLGEHRIWHNVSTCLDFFVRRLGIKKASLSMLINEVKRMAEEAQPRIDEVRTRLISIGYLLTKHPMSAGTTKALDDLKEVKFLPKNAGENDHILVGVTDDFAIPDHQRYRHALLAHNVLLAFELDDVQMLHAMFEHLGLTGRYLSNTIKEVSTVEDSHENVTLSRQLQAKAYALYCIISSTLRDLDAIMMEEDIPPVRWIEKPVLDITELVAEERPHTTVLLADDSDAATLVQLRSGIMTPEMTPQRGRVMERPVAEVVVIETVRPSLYPELIEQVVRSARRAASRYTGVEVSGADTLAAEGQRYFDTASTFGSVEQSMWRRIGAAGEAYIFELLSNLNIPTFTLANWQSTIRGELSVSTHFSRISNWLGRETADLVYKDCTGDLTQYLRAHCEGSFPSQISERRNFMRDPIEYFLEVKSSTHDYSTRFYMSGGQYTRMENMALEEDTPPSRVYVILRVYDLTRPNVGLKIFVDPMRFKGRELDFEAEKWYVTAR